MKKNIAIIFGGFSGERVISERSSSVVKAYLNSNLYDSYLVDIGIDTWELVQDEERYTIEKNDFSVFFRGQNITFDAVFCAIHGTPGEDGKIQGYFDMLGIPYNNCGVLASSITFDKAACNRYLKASGVNVANSFIARLGEDYDVDSIVKKVALPCFVKPNDGGSSIGISKVKRMEDLVSAITNAQQEGVDALIESLLVGTEVSCGCIKLNNEPTAIGVTEIVPGNEFFDFESKYDHAGTQEITPARISDKTYQEVQELTENIYKWLHCKGMIRVDYMICSNGIYLIEVNTTPGLSEASIIPQQAKHYGLTLEEFFDSAVAEMFKS
ncbi:D-alanine--D-alanine ligase [Salibacteraceae bacterium]|nr:D-alanine--D-alanine ligase [Salibacteraceae bacterium]